MSFWENYKNLSDLELMVRLRDGELDIMEYLLNKYKPLVKKQARTMYLIGGETDDLIQEGMIGLFKAIQKYNPKEESSFFSFAELCITRQMYTAIQASNRMKHAPLNTYVSLEQELPLLLEQNPEDLLIDQENLEDCYGQIDKCLSNLEKLVLELYLEGKTYGQIAKIIGKNEKAVDNSIQRVKKKLEKSEKSC